MGNTSNTIHLWPGITLALEVEYQEASGTEPDPNWTFVDAKGHGHFFSPGERFDSHYPTLKWKHQPCTMGHGKDCDAEGHYECRHCREVITPRTRDYHGQVETLRRYVLEQQWGNTHFVYKFGTDKHVEFNAAVGAVIHEAVRNALAGCETEVTYTG